MAATDELIPSRWSGKDWDVTVTNTGMTAMQSGRRITVSSSEISRLRESLGHGVTNAFASSTT